MIQTRSKTFSEGGEQNRDPFNSTRYKSSEKQISINRRIPYYYLVQGKIFEESFHLFVKNSKLNIYGRLFQTKALKLYEYLINFQSKNSKQTSKEASQFHKLIRKIVKLLDNPQITEMVQVSEEYFHISGSGILHYIRTNNLDFNKESVYLLFGPKPFKQFFNQLKEYLFQKATGGWQYEKILGKNLKDDEKVKFLFFTKKDWLRIEKEKLEIKQEQKTAQAYKYSVQTHVLRNIEVMIKIIWSIKYKDHEGSSLLVLDQQKSWFFSEVREIPVVQTTICFVYLTENIGTEDQLRAQILPYRQFLQKQCEKMKVSIYCVAYDDTKSKKPQNKLTIQSVSLQIQGMINKRKQYVQSRNKSL